MEEEPVLAVTIFDNCLSIYALPVVQNLDYGIFYSHVIVGNICKRWSHIWFGVRKFFWCIRGSLYPPAGRYLSSSHVSTHRRLGSLGACESPLLLTEWNPRAIHFHQWKINLRSWSWAGWRKIHFAFIIDIQRTTSEYFDAAWSPIDLNWCWVILNLSGRARCLRWSWCHYIWNERRTTRDLKDKYYQRALPECKLYYLLYLTQNIGKTWLVSLIFLTFPRAYIFSYLLVVNFKSLSILL